MVSSLVTPEAVLVELPTAGSATRGLALLIDIVVNGFLVSMSMALLAFALQILGVSFVGPVAIGAFAAFAFLVLLPIGTELLWRGRSVGKAITGLKVVGVDGSRVTPRQVFVRGVIALLEIYMSVGALALVASAFSEEGQRLGDMAAGTVVIRRRRVGSSMLPVAFHPPWGFELYVRQLPVRGLSSEDLVVIRDYLLRAPQLDDSARQRLGLELSRRVADLIGVPRPPHVDPQTWLVCVASADQHQPGGLFSDAALGLAPLAPPVTTGAWQAPARSIHPPPPGGYGAPPPPGGYTPVAPQDRGQSRW